jgi:hypothetical protein
VSDRTRHYRRRVAAEDGGSPSIGKRDVERAWLRFTMIWGGACAAVMLSGVAERWDDRELVPFGVILGLGAVLPPALRPPSAAERARPFLQRTATRLGATVIAFSFLMNYFATPYFYDVLHMHYGFRSTLAIRDNPVFLYFLTIAYFATYAALLLAAWRASKKLGRRIPRAIAWLPVAITPFAVAALETALNANPFMTKLFCYDDHALALAFGTASYGACFCFILPVWARIDERGDDRPPGRVIGAWIAAATIGFVVALALLRAFVAPHLTTIEPGAKGLGVIEGTCLAR